MVIIEKNSFEHEFRVKVFELIHNEIQVGCLEDELDALKILFHLKVCETSRLEQLTGTITDQLSALEISNDDLGQSAIRSDKKAAATERKLDRLVSSQTRDQLRNLREDCNHSRSSANASQTRYEELRQTYCALLKVEMQGRLMYQLDEHGQQVGMSLRYISVPNLTVEMRGAENDLVRLLHRQCCVTAGYTIVRAVRQLGLGVEAQQDFLLFITGFKNVFAPCRFDEDETTLFNTYLERAKADNWTSFTMSLQGMLKLQHNLKKIGEYSTQISVGQMYIMLNRANQWLIKHGVPKSLWLIDQADIAHGVNKTRRLAQPPKIQEKEENLQGGLLQNIEQLIQEHDRFKLQEQQQVIDHDGAEGGDDELDGEEERPFSYHYDEDEEHDQDGIWENQPEREDVNWEQDKLD